MITRAEADPDIHVLRSALSLVEGRERSALEAARFGLCRSGSSIATCRRRTSSWGSFVAVQPSKCRPIARSLRRPEESVRRGAVGAPFIEKPTRPGTGKGPQHMSKPITVTRIDDGAFPAQHRYRIEGGEIAPEWSKTLARRVDDVRASARSIEEW